MRMQEWIFRSRQKLRRLTGTAIESAEFDPSDPWTDTPPEKMSGELEAYFWRNKGHAIDKWLHYLPIYERHFTPFRNTPVRVLEIGVQNGGSAQMWRDFLGPDAVIFGIDIDPACASANGEAAQIRIGSQDDAAFLASVLEEMGGVDLVIDDGSHVMAHIEASFRTLFPALSDGGVYLIEDLHTAYWPDYGGGFRAPGSFIEKAKTLIDDMHHWYHGLGQEEAVTANAVGGLHFYDSILVIDKIKAGPPRRAIVGTDLKADSHDNKETP